MDFNRFMTTVKWLNKPSKISRWLKYIYAPFEEQKVLISIFRKLRYDRVTKMYEKRKRYLKCLH